MKWNQFSPEVEAERRMIRDYGECVPKCGDNYKAQALRELAMRLNKESQIEDLMRRIAACVDLLDCMDARVIAQQTGMGEAQAERLRNIALGRS